jgi:hypothetical protein
MSNYSILIIGTFHADVHEFIMIIRAGVSVQRFRNLTLRLPWVNRSAGRNGCHALEIDLLDISQIASRRAIQRGANAEASPQTVHASLLGGRPGRDWLLEQDHVWANRHDRLVLEGAHKSGFLAIARFVLA